MDKWWQRLPYTLIYKHIPSIHSIRFCIEIFVVVHFIWVKPPVCASKCGKCCAKQKWRRKFQNELVVPEEHTTANSKIAKRRRRRSAHRIRKRRDEHKRTEEKNSRINWPLFVLLLLLLPAHFSMKMSKNHFDWFDLKTNWWVASFRWLRKISLSLFLRAKMRVSFLPLIAFPSSMRIWNITGEEDAIGKKSPTKQEKKSVKVKRNKKRIKNTQQQPEREQNERVHTHSKRRRRQQHQRNRYVCVGFLMYLKKIALYIKQ